MSPTGPNPEDAWFAPKRYGYGAGQPIAWQGWVVLVSYMADVLLLAALVGPLAKSHGLLALLPAAGIVLMTIWLIWISARHTRGGWRWRWGEKD